jgi:hypothetical protein
LPLARDGLRNLRPLTAGVAGNTIPPVGCVTPFRCLCIGGRETLPGSHRSQLAAGRWMGCVTSYPLPARREVGTPSPGGLRNLATRCLRTGAGEHCQVKL